MSKRNTTRENAAQSLRESFDAYRHEFAAAAPSVATGILLIAIIAVWIIGQEPLKRRIAAAAPPAITFSIEWPTSGSGRETWLPESIRQDLARIAATHLTDDPFDRLALDETRRALIATGWLTEATTVSRRPGGQVTISGEWRIPAAIVLKHGHTYLVAHSGELLRLPLTGAFDATGMFLIHEPEAGPPTDQTGAIVYGAPWPYQEVQPAIELLLAAARTPAIKRIVGVDLRRFADTEQLTLITDSGCSIVWGSPIGQLAPGEVPVDARLERLATILSQRLDEGQAAIDLYLPRAVLIDRTASAG